MPSVIDLVKCTVHGRFERSAKVAEKYRASRFVYGSTFTQLMRCLGTNSASTVKRLVDEAVEELSWFIMRLEHSSPSPSPKPSLSPIPIPIPVWM